MGSGFATAALCGLLLGAAAALVIWGEDEGQNQHRRECELMAGAWYAAPQDYVFTLPDHDHAHEIWVYSTGTCITEVTP